MKLGPGYNTGTDIVTPSVEYSCLYIMTYHATAVGGNFKLKVKI
jgi:hypothetical protein